MLKHLNLIAKITLWIVVITATYTCWTLGYDTGVVAGCAGVGLASWPN